MPQGKTMLRCVGCSRTYDPPAMHCDRCAGLLRADYPVKAFQPRNDGTLFDFRDWLPSTSTVDTPVGPTVYPGERFAAHLGLRKLTVAFNGYAPEVGATNPTGSFKDFEALPTVLYRREHGIDSLIIDDRLSVTFEEIKPAQAFQHFERQQNIRLSFFNGR